MRTTPSGRRTRLDDLLVRRGLLPTRAKAHGVILAGEVYVDGRRVEKPGTAVAESATVEVRLARPPFVSRGGYKLDHALRAFAITVDGLTAADIGASTGGFTDCLLQRGAAHVVAIDVGTGQLDWRLRNDPRVTSLERRDVRDVTPGEFGRPVNLATIDVAFISLVKVLPAVQRLLRSGGTAIALVKPQFEAGPKQAKRGVVRDPAVHRRVLEHVIKAARAGGWTVLNATPSPVPGPEGNLEFFLHLRNSPQKVGASGDPGTASAPGETAPVDIDAVVTEAHARPDRQGAS